MKTARRYRTIEIQAGPQTITAADPLSDDLRQALDTITRAAEVRTSLSQLGFRQVRIPTSVRQRLGHSCQLLFISHRLWGRPEDALSCQDVVADHVSAG